MFYTYVIQSTNHDEINMKYDSSDLMEYILKFIPIQVKAFHILQLIILAYSAR